MKKLILIGDSIRMQYQVHVTSQLTELVNVWGPEANGGNSANVRQHLDEWLISQAPDVVHINCGLHDLKRDLDGPSTAVSLADYEDNLRHILTRILQETQAKVIWATTTPVNEKWHHRRGFDRLEADVTAYNKVAVDVASELDVPINNLFQVVTDAGRDDHLKPDGVHFNEAGCDLLGTAVARCVKMFI